MYFISYLDSVLIVKMYGILDDKLVRYPSILDLQSTFSSGVELAVCTGVETSCFHHGTVSALILSKRSSGAQHPNTEPGPK